MSRRAVVVDAHIALNSRIRKAELLNQSINSLSPKINTHFLLTVLYIFRMEPLGDFVKVSKHLTIVDHLLILMTSMFDQVVKL